MIIDEKSTCRRACSLPGRGAVAQWRRARAGRALGAIAVALACASARADDATRLGLAVTGGLSGPGADIGLNINSYFGLRGTVAGFSFNRNGSYGTSATWNASLTLFQAGLLLDAYPFAGRFHVSGGLVKDGNKLALTAQPVAGTYTFNGNAYSSAQVTAAAANVSWNKAVPYLGLGWGNLAGSPGLHFTTDLGAMITGSPTSTVSATCSTVGQQDGICQRLATDLGAEQAKLQNYVHSATFWPVIRFGIGYAF